MNPKGLRLADRPEFSRTVSARVLHAPYLFADSVPFSHNFDFISVLECFVDLAADVLADARAMRDLEHEIARARGELAQNVVVLHKLENEVVDRAVNLLFTYSNPAIEEVATRLDDVARNLCGRSRADLQAAFDSQTSVLDTQIRKHQVRMTSAVRRFFLASDLEVTRERFSLILTEDGYRVRLKQRVEGDITARFEVAPEKTYWSEPRRVSDLVPGFRLGVGMRRKPFSRAMGLETRALGDYLIGRVHFEGDKVEVSLRRRPEEQDSLQIELSRYDDGVTGRVLHADAPNAPFDVPLEQGKSMVTLWNALAGACVAEKAARATLAKVSLGDEDVLNARGAEVLVDYLLAAYRPIVAELLDHGAASGELSLKRDLGDGRREERFVSLSRLIEKVSGLGDEERAWLRRLGLQRAAPRPSGIPAEPGCAPKLVHAAPENGNDAAREVRP